MAQVLVILDIERETEMEHFDLGDKLHEVLNYLDNLDSKLGRAFNAIERLGYLRIALTAWERSKEIDQKSEAQLFASLRRLACEVVPNHHDQLVEYAKIYPPVALYLDNQKEVIKEVLAAAPGIGLSQVSARLDLE